MLSDAVQVYAVQLVKSHRYERNEASPNALWYNPWRKNPKIEVPSMWFSEAVADDTIPKLLNSHKLEGNILQWSPPQTTLSITPFRGLGDRLPKKALAVKEAPLQRLLKHGKQQCFQANPSTRPLNFSEIEIGKIKKEIKAPTWARAPPRTTT